MRLNVRSSIIAVFLPYEILVEVGMQHCEKQYFKFIEISLKVTKYHFLTPATFIMALINSKERPRKVVMHANMTLKQTMI